MTPDQVDLRFRQLEEARKEGRLLERVAMIALIEGSSGLAKTKGEIDGLNLAMRIIQQAPLGN